MHFESINAFTINVESNMNLNRRCHIQIVLYTVQCTVHQLMQNNSYGTLCMHTVLEHKSSELELSVGQQSLVQTAERKKREADHTNDQK